MGDWSEELHPRDGEGQFTHSTIGAWAKAAAEQLGGGARFLTSTRQAAMRGDHPAGHAAAKARLEHLWNIADGKGAERTDAEQAELEEIERAFDTYRFKLGLKHETTTLHTDESGAKWTQYGEHLGHITNDPPLSMQRGFTRVGDAPGLEGRVGGADPRYYRPSTHPAAGGVWINPASPGTRHAPNYLNDMGHGISEMRPKESRSQRHKEGMQSRRYEGNYGTNENVEHETVWRGRRTPGRMGYDLPNRDGNVSEFIAVMKRVRARNRLEAPPRQPKRRTPRGTRVDTWMGQASTQMEQQINRRMG